MKKLFSVIVFILCSSIAFSQTLIFCEKVDSTGTPHKPSHVFTVSKQGGFFDFLVVLPESVNSEEAKYDIFKVEENGKENFYDSISREIHKEWVWFPIQVTFYKSGDYTVYVYTAEDRLLCTGMVKVIMQ